MTDHGYERMFANGGDPSASVDEIGYSLSRVSLAGTLDCSASICGLISSGLCSESSTIPPIIIGDLLFNRILYNQTLQPKIWI